MVYVRSEANVADMPSRGDLSYVTAVLGSEERPTTLPPIESWGSVAGALAVAEPAGSEKENVRRRRR